MVNWTAGDKITAAKLNEMAYGQTYTYTFYKEGTTYYADAHRSGDSDVSGTDGSTVLQTAIDNTSGNNGGIVWIRNGVYSLGTAITGKNNVSLWGEGMGDPEDFTTRGVILNYTGPNATAFLNYNACRWFSLVDIKLKNGGGNTVDGILLGDTTNSANKSKFIYMRNVAIDAFVNGIKGNTFGPDDSTWENCYVSNATTIAVDNMSSQSKWIGGSITSSPIGVRIQRAAGAGAADAAMQFWGTVWSSCPVAIDIAGSQSINTLTLTGCWIEGSTDMILDTGNATAGTSLGHVVFDNCTMSTPAGANSIMDLSGVNIWVTVRGGTLYPNDSGEQIICNGAGGTTQRLRLDECIGHERIAISDTGSGVRGFNAKFVPMLGPLRSAQPHTHGAAVGGAWTATGYSTAMCGRPTTIVKAYAVYRWDPMSASGKIRMATATNDWGESAPGAAGARLDKVDCTTDIRGEYEHTGNIDIEIQDDGANQPQIWQVGLILEW